MPQKKETEGMLGIVLISQGSLATSLQEGVEHMLGEQPNIQSIALETNENLESAQNRLENAIEQFSHMKAIVILADLFGGTPCNAAMKFYKKGSLEVIAGVNLPFVVQLANMKGAQSLNDAIDAAHSAGHRYLISCGDHIGYNLS